MSNRLNLPPLIGLVALFGPAAAGKSTLLLNLHHGAGLPVYRRDEPLEPRTASFSDLPYDEESGALDVASLPDISALDSLRTLLFGGGGAAMKGGLSSGALLRLTQLHNDLTTNGKGVLAAVNPVYDVDTTTSQYTMVRDLISGSVGGLLEATLDPGSAGSHRDAWQSTSLWDVAPGRLSPSLWRVHRDRFGQLEPWVDLLSQIDPTNTTDH